MASIAEKILIKDNYIQLLAVVPAERMRGSPQWVSAHAALNMKLAQAQENWEHSPHIPRWES